MKLSASLNAVKFQFILITLMTIAIIITTGVFIFGYRYMQSVGEETAKRQADATASEDSIGTLQRLKIQLSELDGVSDKLSNLRSSNSLPQFDTERSLRAITGQLGLGVRDISFVDGGSSDTVSAAGTTAAPATASNSRITFQFDRPLTYSELISFLNAVETSTPKLSLEGVSLPDGSTRSSIEVGTLTLELATK